MATIVGSGGYRYEVIENWGKLPDGWGFREVAAVAVDRKDNVYVFNRGEHPMMVFDRDGNFLRSWGEGLFQRAARRAHRPRRRAVLHRRRRPHGAKMHAEGKMLLEIGVPGKPAPLHERRAVQPLHAHRAVSGGRHLRLRRLRQRARPQVLAGRQAAVVVGRAGHRSRRSSTSCTTSAATTTAGSTLPTARTIACRCSTATASTRRSGTTCTARAACS